jgi:alanine dehydrogenase
MLVCKGLDRALGEHQGLQRGVNTESGRITYPAVAKALGYA